MNWGLIPIYFLNTAEHWFQHLNVNSNVMQTAEIMFLRSTDKTIESLWEMSCLCNPATNKCGCLGVEAMDFIIYTQIHI
jgi:hypothetical protein